jgi:hypothetical protein
MLREAFAGGPAYITHDAVTYQFHDDWTAKYEVRRIPRKTNLQGTVGRSLDCIIAKIVGKPIATSVNLQTLINKLYARRASGRGSMLFGASDKPLVIQAKDGRSLTFSAAGISKQPTVRFAPNVDLFDTVEWTCLLATNGDSADITDYIVEASSAYTEPTLDPLSIISERYALAWGEDEPFDDIETDEAGIVLEPSLSWTEKPTQKDGLLNFRQEDLTGLVKFTPVNLGSSDFVELIAAVGRGKMLGTFGLPLTVTPVSGEGPTLTVPLATPVDPEARFGQESRVGEVTMECERAFEEGAMQEPFTLAVAA